MKQIVQLFNCLLLFGFLFSSTASKANSTSNTDEVVSLRLCSLDDHTMQDLKFDLAANPFSLKRFYADHQLALVTDNCAGAVDVNLNITPLNVIGGDNTGFTQDATNVPTCQSPTGPYATDWYSIVVTAGNNNVTFQLTAGSIISPSIGLYQTCASTTALFSQCPASGNDILWTVCLPPGTYKLQIASTAANAGTYDLNVTAGPTTVTNDDCATNQNIATAGTSPATNNCSADGFVWYSYTVVNGGAVNITATGGFTIGTVQSGACGGTTLTMPTTCVLPGTTLFFSAGSPTMFGNFNVNIQDNPSPAVNDLCTNASALNNMGGNNVLNCGETGNFIGNANACPDPQASACFGATTRGVWYTFTTDAQVSSITINGVGGGVYELFTGTCGALTSLGCAINTFAVTPSTTYTLLVGSAGSVNVVADQTIPTNDLCNNATNLTSAGLTNQFNTCATTDNIQGCAAQSNNVVWYTFTMPATDENATITITGVGVDPISNPAVAVYSGGCGGLNLIDAECSQTISLECLTPGTTYRVAVGSATADAGTFNISLTTSDNGVVNDVCANATAIPSTPTCQYFPVNTNTTNACPEAFNATCNGGNNNADATVWLSFTVPTGVNSINIRNITPAGAYLQIFPACGAGATIAGGNCISGAGPTGNIAVTAGTTYFVAVAIANGEGAVNFDLRYNLPPNNDLCPNAINLAVGGGPVNGTNACATPFATPYCGLNTTTSHSVYYTYTVPATNTTNSRVEIIVNGNTATTGDAANNIAVGLFQNCGGTVFNANVESGTLCNALAGPIVLDCVAPGTQITLAIGSADGDEGDFSIQVNQNTSSFPSNDLCTNPTVLSLNPVCEFQTFNGTNVGACPELISGGTCQLNNQSTVWYQFTLPPGSIGLGVEDLTGGVNLAIFNNNCAAPGYAPTQIGNCITGNIDITTGLTAGTTYLIAATSATEGPFSFDLKPIIPPANDLCAGAITATVGGSTSGTNICATPENPQLNGPSCAPADQTNTVFFTFTIPAGNKGVNITITGVGANPIAGNIHAAVWEAVCDLSNGAFVDDVCTTSGTLVDAFECIGPGTYTIRIASSSANEGDFNLTITPIAFVQPNDLCTNATVLTLNPVCEFQTFNGTNVGACPELITGGSCQLNNQPTVWYQITLPPGSVGLGIEDLTGGVNLAIFNNNCTAPGLAPTQIGNCITGNIDITTGLTAGTTYLIAATSATEGPFSFDLKPIIPPANDLCAGAITATVGGSTAGTNTCATPENPQLNGPSCAPADQTNTVFFTFTIPAGNKGVNITITGVGANPIAGNIHAAVWEGVCDLSNGAFVDDVCTTSGTLVDAFECIGPGTYTIRIASSSANEGDFNLTITPLAIAQPNDLCTNAQTIANTPTCEFFPVPVTSTVGACPEEFTVAGCALNYSMDAIVWYQFTTPAGTVSIEIEDISGGAFLSVVTGCPNPTTTIVGGGNCLTGAGTNGTPIIVTPNTTYYVAIGIPGNEGNVGFDLKYNLQVPNDNPCVANPPFTVVTLASGAPSPAQNNTCATADVEMCGNANINKTLWYEFTVTAPNNTLTINVSGQGADPLASPAIAVFENGTACGGAQPEAEDCDFDGQLVITCINPGVYQIQVGSTTPNAGEFTITATQSQNTNSPNDACTNAIVLQPTELCVDLEFSGSNIQACPENLPPGQVFAGCNFNAEETSWYSITVPGAPGDPNPEMTFEFTSYTGTGTPFMNVFNQGANCANLTALGTNCFSGVGTDFQIGEVMAGQTYLIAISSNNDTGGESEFTIKFTAGPDNDERCAAAIATGFALGNGGSMMGTTLCAGPDYTIPGCGNADVQNAVYFTFVVGPNDRGMNISVVGSGANPIPGGSTIGLGVFEDPCNSNVIEEGACINLGGNYEFLCLEEGVYYIQVSTSTANEGDFTITATPLAFTTNCANTLNNDECEDALSINPQLAGNICEPVTISGCNQQACSETFNFGANCPFGDMPVVWYSFSTGTNVNSVDITNVTGNAFMAIFTATTACQDVPTAISPCITGNQNGIAVDENTTYYIAVGVNNMAGGNFTFDITLNQPPENDDPVVTSDNPPLDLTGGGNHSGTTCCAIGAADMVGTEYGNVGCAGGALDENAVWYTYTPTTEDGIEIILNNISIMGGNVAIEVYSGSATAPAQLATPNSFRCGAAAFGNPLVVGCYEEGITLWIKVTTSNASCGDFSISILPKEPSCEMADVCEEITQIIEPVSPTNETTPPTPVCVTGCLDLYCPEPNPICQGQQFQTVWFQVNTDGFAQAMNVLVNTNGWAPVVAIYEAGNISEASCATAQPLGGCEFGTIASGVSVPQVGVNGNQTYYIAVSFFQGSLADPSFTLCVSTGPDYKECSINQELKIVSRSAFPNEPTPPNGFNGPFCMGEEVEVCYSLTFTNVETACQWFQGAIPQFGPGWDMSYFQPTSHTFNPSNGATWSWWPEGEVLYNEGNPFLCTFTNSQGVLQLCHPTFIPNCPCTAGLPADAPLPAGWFAFSNGGGPACTNTGNPNTGWGVPMGCNSSLDFEICFNLKVRNFETSEECLTNNDLYIRMFPFADGETGCWGDVTCAGDVPELRIELINCDNLIEVTAPDAEICTGQTLNIPINTVPAGAPATIFVTPDPNPNVTGATPFTFTGGSGVINNTLVNTSGTTQIVIYRAFAREDGQICPGPEIEIEVTVYPNLIVQMPDTYVCAMECTSLTPTFTGGTGTAASYQWSTGATTPSINVCPTVTTTYIVTITDTNGCTGTQDAIVDVKLPVNFVINPNDINVCPTGNFAITTINVENIQANGSYTLTWNTPAGLDGTALGGGSNSFIFYADSSAPGDYELCATVVDEFGCENTKCIDVTIASPPDMFVEYIQPPCGQTTVNLPVTVFSQSGSSATIILETCTGTFIAQQTNVTFHIFPNVNISDVTCLRVRIIENGSGCTKSEQIQINLPTGQQVALSAPAAVCAGETATVSVTNASLFTSYQWSTGASGPASSITVTPTPPSTIYRVTATDAAGCTSQATVEINVSPAPTINISGSTSFCVGSSTTLTASSGAGSTFEWFDGAGTSIGTTAVINITSGGDYTVVVTNSIGCTNQQTTTVIEDDNLSPVLPNVSLCDNEPQVLDAGAGFDTYTWSQDGNPLSETGSSITVTAAGEYCVTVTDAAGCSGEVCEIVTNTDTPVATVTDSIQVCRQDNGTLPTFLNFNAQVSGSTGTWVEITGSGVDLSDLSNVDFTGIATGFYTFRYTTDSAEDPCEDQEYLMVVRVRTCPCEVLSIDPLPALCNNNTTGINLNTFKPNPIAGTWTVVNGPQLPVAIQNGSFFVPNGLQAGTYRVRFEIPAAGICPTSVEADIVVNDAPFAGVVGNRILCNATSPVGPTTIDLNTLLVPNTDPGTWTQVSGPTTIGTLPNIDADGLTAGAVYVFRYTTTDAVAPCQNATADVTITIRDCNCPLIQIAAIPDICNNDGPFDLNTYLTVDPAGLAGTWTVNGSPISGSIFNPAGLPIGSIPVVFTLTDPVLPTCTNNATANVIIRRQPIIELVTGPQPCNEDTGNGPTTIQLNSWLNTTTTSAGTWTQVSGPTITIAGNSAVNFAGQPVGTVFVFRYTTTGAIAPCENISQDITITVRDCNCPNVATTAPAPVCNNSTTPLNLATLETANIGVGVWTVTGPSGNNVSLNGKLLTVTGLPAGNYTLTYTLNPAPSGTCPPSSSQTLVIENQANATVVPTRTVCNVPAGGSNQILNFNTFITNGPTNGTWVNVDGAPVSLANLANVDFSNAPIGAIYRFDYIVSNAAPCTDDVNTIVIEVIDCTCPPINPLDPRDFCTTEGSINLVQFNDPARPGTWSSTELTIVNNTIDLSSVATGNYTLTYTVSDAEPGCPTSVTRMITIVRQAVVGTAQSIRFCQDAGQLVILNDLLTGEDAGGTWREVSGTLSQGGAFNAALGQYDARIPQAPGTYVFEYSFANNSPCPDVATTVTVIVDNNPRPDLGPERLLDCINTTATISSNLTGAGFTYNWAHQGGGTITNPTAASITVNFPGVFIITVTDVVTGCTGVDDVVVNISDDLPTASINKTDVRCFGENNGSIQFVNVQGGTAPLQYSINGGTSFQATPNFNNLAPGTYNLLMRDAIGCVFTSQIQITQPAALSLELGPNQFVTLNTGVTLTVSDKFDMTRVANITWTKTNSTGSSQLCSGGVECATIAEVPQETTTYCATITDLNGCIIQDCITIIIEKARNLVIPNVINPGNGINGSFFINSDDVASIRKIFIFDRWGEKVFSVENIQPGNPVLGWNGKFKGQDVVPGVYVYLVEVEFKTFGGETTPDVETYTGDVTVIR